MMSWIEQGNCGDLLDACEIFLSKEFLIAFVGFLYVKNLLH